MPTLDWIGKQAVLHHHREIPFHLLTPVEALSAGDADAGNLVVQGDNLLALKALLPYYAQQVKCIYIDPPYNTGKEGWIYNDAVNSPEMRQWLGKVVGAEGEDLSRHDKWLCMMYPRLRLLKQFMAPGGVIFISIGKHEVGNLRVLCDEVFGPQNLLETFIWQVEGNTENQEDITANHEYVLAYERRKDAAEINATIDPNIDDASKLLRDFAENSVIKNAPANPASIITLPIGFPCAADSLVLPRHDFADRFMEQVSAEGGYIRRETKAEFGVEFPIRLDDMVVEGSELVQPCRVYSGWSSARKLRRFIEVGMSPLDEQDGSRLRYFLSERGVPMYFREGRTGHFVPTILRNMGTVEKAGNDLERMGLRFPYPKPVQLIEHLVGLYAKPGDLVLDSFAGSGTTGHAVMKLNAERHLGLRFLLIELADNIAREVTVPRLRSLTNGCEVRRGNRRIKVPGYGGGFRFVKLGESLFDENGGIREGVTYDQLARHVYFVETGTPLPATAVRTAPLLGVHDGRAVYLLYNGVLGDRKPDGGNILTSTVLAGLPPHDGPKVVYAEGSRLGSTRLERARVTVKQTPYDVRVGA